MDKGLVAKIRYTERAHALIREAGHMLSQALAELSGTMSITEPLAGRMRDLISNLHGIEHDVDDLRTW